MKTPSTKFFCVFVKTRKKFDKFIKINKIKNKYVIDVRKLMDDEELTYKKDRVYLKVLVYQKIQQAIKKNKDVYYIPDFSLQVNVGKLLNIKEMLTRENEFNVIVFWNEFLKTPELLEDILDNLHNFDTSNILKDYWLSEKEQRDEDSSTDIDEEEEEDED